MTTNTVGDAMNRHVLTVDADDTLSTALQLMLWTGGRHLPVVHEDRLVGVLTERDILRYQAQCPSPDALAHAVGAAASTPVKFTHPEDSLTEATERLAADKVGCLPVVVQGELVGLLTVTDLLAFQVQHAMSGTPETLCAKDVMTEDPILVYAGDKLDRAVERMAVHGIRHLPVVDGEGRLCGILSDRDVRPIARRWTLEETPVERMMTRTVITLKPTSPLSALLDAFTTWHLSALPIVDDDDRPVGIVSYIDLLRVLGR